MKHVYTVMATTLGSPPRPDETFLFETYDKDGKYVKVEATPIEFSKVRRSHLSVSIVSLPGFLLAL